MTLTWEKEIVAVASYLLRSEDDQVRGAVRLLKERAKSGAKNKRKGVLYEANRLRERYNIEEELLPLTHPEEASAAQHKNLLKELDKAQKESLVKRLVKKVYNGPYARETRKVGVDKKATYCWLREGKLKPQTESVVAAAQDGVTPTKGRKARFTIGPADPLCRLCHSHTETIGHLLSKCPVYEHREYTTRHDSVLYLLVRAVAEKLNIKIPQSVRKPGGGVRSGVIREKGVTLLIDLTLPTDRQTENRRPDLVVRLGKEKRVIVFEIAVTWDPSVEEREREKRAKYSDLAADLAHQWQGYRITVVPVVVGDLGVIRNLRRYMKQAKILDTKEIAKFAAEAQREVLCWNVKLIKRTLVVPE